MLLELTVGGLLLLAYKKSASKGVLSPKRQEVYESALETLTDPDKLRELAVTFEKEGLPIEANMLRKRADLRGQSPATKAERAKAYDKGMKSNDIPGIERLADAFESLTATGAASQLRKRAAMLRENPPKVEHEFVTDQPGAAPVATAEDKDLAATQGRVKDPTANGATHPKRPIDQPVIDTTAEPAE